MIVIIVVVLVFAALGYNWYFDRRTAAANALKWAPLTPLIAGRVKGDGIQGTYHGRPVTALIDIINAGGRSYLTSVSSRWTYLLTLGASGTPAGQDWEVDCTGPEPRHFSGNEAVWRQVLAGVGADGLRATGFGYFHYTARKGELTGARNFKEVTLNSDVKELMALGKSPPPPPTPEEFTVQLDFLARLAEINQAVNLSA